jgi:hypothetical protein
MDQGMPLTLKLHCMAAHSERVQVLDEPVSMEDTPTWFEGAKLNWAENMLKCRSKDKIAIVEVVGRVARLSERSH